MEWRKTMIYTSYFANLKNLPSDIIPISICGKAPTGYHGIQYKKLAPKYDFFMQWKLNHDNEYYIRCYNEQVLAALDPHEVYAELNTLSGGREFVLVCYERPEDFCHRHLVAKWLVSNGYPCVEYV